MDQIYKLQPHRTMALQGFDDYGAAGALWGASDTGFTVSGVFRDLADFAVLVLFQKNDPFGHPLFSYLPDGDLTGLVLDFDITWQGIQSWESLKSAWTDWNTLDYSINGVGDTDVKWIGTPGITITCNTTVLEEIRLIVRKPSRLRVRETPTCCTAGGESSAKVQTMRFRATESSAGPKGGSRSWSARWVSRRWRSIF